MRKTQEKFRNKKILIWGYGREGKSTERFLEDHCAPAAVDVYEGVRDGVRDELYDYVFVSPGIQFEEDASAFENAKFTSQTEVFLEEFGAQTIGITGTKGKSTTCSLLHTVLSACSGRRTLLMGNIGKPCFDYLAQMDDDSIAVFEMSCHQCQRLQAAPHVAVFLNLYEDHLDRYLTMEHYFAAKCGITRGQGPEDFLLLGQQVPEVATKAQAVRVLPGKERFDLRIPGEHNQYNARFVYELAVILCGCDGKAVCRAMATFSGLPHRLQHVGCYGGVDYYDDSISTIPQATIQAVTSVPHVKTVLVGGMDRGVDYTVLEDFIREHQEMNFILAYASGKRILEEMKGSMGARTGGDSAMDASAGGSGAESAAEEIPADSCVQETGACPNAVWVGDLAEQVKKAREITPAGSAVVMSNAAASYGYFKDFEERGDMFQCLVRGAQ